MADDRPTPEGSITERLDKALGASEQEPRTLDADIAALQERVDQMRKLDPRFDFKDFSDWMARDD